MKKYQESLDYLSMNLGVMEAQFLPNGVKDETIKHRDNLQTLVNKEKVMSYIIKYKVTGFEYYFCPKCNENNRLASVEAWHKYCPICGQRIKRVK